MSTISNQVKQKYNNINYIEIRATNKISFT